LPFNAAMLLAITRFLPLGSNRSSLVFTRTSLPKHKISLKYLCCFFSVALLHAVSTKSFWIPTVHLWVLQALPYLNTTVFLFLLLCPRQLAYHFLWIATGHLRGLLALPYPNNKVSKISSLHSLLPCRRYLDHHIVWLATGHFLELLSLLLRNIMVSIKYLYPLSLFLCPRQLVYHILWLETGIFEV